MDFLNKKEDQQTQHNDGCKVTRSVSTSEHRAIVPTTPAMPRLGLATNIDPIKALSFPVKLHAILSRADLSSIIGWMPHGRSWSVHQPKLFEQHVVPEFFVHCKYSSFIRQAQSWGFTRINEGPDLNSYYHKYFLRGRLHLCRHMTRLSDAARKKKRKAARQVVKDPDDTNLPNFYKMSELDLLPDNLAACSGNGKSSVAVTATMAPASTDTMERLSGLTKCDGNGLVPSPVQHFPATFYCSNSALALRDTQSSPCPLHGYLGGASFGEDAALANLSSCGGDGSGLMGSSCIGPPSVPLLSLQNLEERERQHRLADGGCQDTKEAILITRGLSILAAPSSAHLSIGLQTSSNVGGVSGGASFGFDLNTHPSLGVQAAAALSPVPDLTTFCGGTTMIPGNNSTPPHHPFPSAPFSRRIPLDMHLCWDSR